MRMRKFEWALIVLLLFLASSIRAAEPEVVPVKIAVLDFEAFGVPQVTAVYLTDKLRERLLQTGSYQLVGKDVTVTAAKDKNLDLEDCSDDDCVAALGETLAVEQMLLGTLSKSGANYLLTLRLVDVKTKKVSNIINSESVCTEELLPQLVNLAAEKLIDAEQAGQANKQLYQGVPRIAVALIDLQDLGVSEVAAYALSDVIRAQLFARNYLDVMDRSTMAKTLRENQFSLVNCATVECAQQVGKLLEVEKVISGTFGQLGKKYSLSLKMVDTASGEIANAVSQDFYARIEELPAYVRMLTDLLIEKDLAAETGTLRVLSHVESRVYLNGELKGEIKNPSQPLVWDDLRPGIYDVKIDRINNTEEIGSVILGPKQTVSFPVTNSLAEIKTPRGENYLNTNALALLSHPTGASVFLNGIYQGVTPLLLENLTPKFYEVKFLLKRHKELLDYVFVAENKMTTVERSLRPAEQIIFVSDRDGNREIYRIDDDGENLLRLTYNEADDFSPVWDADGKGFVFITNRDNELKSNLYHAEIESAAEQALTTDFNHVFSPSYTAKGEILFLGEKSGQTKLYLVSKNGENLREYLVNEADILMPAASPDGNYLAYVTDYKRSSEIFLFDTNSRKSKSFTENFSTWDGYPAWRYDGKKIAYIAKSYTEDYDELVVKDIDSGLTEILLDELTVAKQDPEWAADGKRLVYVAVDSSGNSDLYLVNADGGNKFRLTNHIAYDGEPAWLPPEPLTQPLLPVLSQPLGQVKQFLQFARATVIIESEPAGAEVYIDGIKYNGVTPLTITDLKYGLHNLVLLTPEYVRWGMIDVREGDNIFKLVLRKRNSILELISEPQGVTVYLDGKNMGRTPLVVSAMWGMHIFRFVKPEYQDQELSYYVEAAKMNKIKIIMEQK